MTDEAAPGPGHNSGDTVPGGIAGDHLRSLIERIERLEEEKKALQADIKEIYDEAKSQGFVPKIIRQIVKLRRRETQEIQEEQTLLELYGSAIGMEMFT